MSAFTALAFSVVLAEAFAAVGISTLVPAVVVEVLRNLRKAQPDPLNEVLYGVAGVFLKVLGNPTPAATTPGTTPPPPDDALKALATILPNDAIQLMVPKTATIDAQFSMSGKESITEGAGLGAQLEVVTVHAGMSALFESTSSTTIKLHVDFAVVEYRL